MGLTKRRAKGVKLTIDEMDENLAYLMMTLSGSNQLTGSFIQEQCTGSGTQVVVGNFNRNGDTTSKFIVGRGSNTGSSALDAFKVTWSGSIVVGGTNGTGSAAPAWTGTDGEIYPVTISGVHYLYMSMGGTWVSRSFA